VALVGSSSAPDRKKQKQKQQQKTIIKTWAWDRADLEPHTHDRSEFVGLEV
jgi:hypothetical protein